MNYKRNTLKNGCSPHLDTEQRAVDDLVFEVLELLMGAVMAGRRSCCWEGQWETVTTMVVKGRRLDLRASCFLVVSS